MPLAVVNTNLSRASLPTDFMKKLSDFIVKELECPETLTTVDVHAGLHMIRGGSKSPMVNLFIHHCDDKIFEGTKTSIASKFAEFLADLVKIVRLDRILVLFFDARLMTPH